MAEVVDCEHDWKWEQGCEDWEEYWRCEKCGEEEG